MTRTNEVDQSFRPNMSYILKVQASEADMSYKPYIENQPCAKNTIKEGNNSAENTIKVGNNINKRKTWTEYESKVVGKYKCKVVGDSKYEPEVIDVPDPRNTNGVNQDFGADMRYSPQETGADKTVNKPQSHEVDQSFSPNMSYEPKFSHNQDFGEDISDKSPTIGEDKPYEHKPSADEETKKTNQAVRKDMSYKPGVKNTKKTNPKAPNMSYKPEVSSTPRAINTNGVNQAFGADMSYSPDIAKNTKLAGADMSYSPRIKNKPYFHDK